LAYPPDEAVEHAEILDIALQHKDGAYKSEKRYICKNGAVVWVSVNLATVLDKKGGPIYFVGQFEDISERKIAEEHLKNAYQQIEDHVRSIHDIAWKQSHLIRSPLANLQALIALLKDDPSGKETLDHIETELQRLDNVILEMAEDASAIGAVQIAVKKRILKLPIKQLPIKLRTANGML
jgi:signal transduction histidine kinase